MRRRVELRDDIPRSRIGRGALRELARRLDQAARCLDIPAQHQAPVTVSVVDEAQMSALHLRWMGLAGPTDVLSFPAASLQADLGPDEMLGDIALCWPVLTRQALRGPARDLLHEASVLGVHGLVHLCGHDHRTRRQSRRMHRAELRVLRALGLPDLPRPYAS